MGSDSPVHDKHISPKALINIILTGAFAFLQLNVPNSFTSFVANLEVTRQKMIIMTNSARVTWPPIAVSASVHCTGRPPSTHVLDAAPDLLSSKKKNCWPSFQETGTVMSSPVVRKPILNMAAEPGRFDTTMVPEGADSAKLQKIASPANVRLLSGGCSCRWQIVKICTSLHHHVHERKKMFLAPFVGKEAHSL